MTKQYPILHLGNEMYMIDKKKYARIGSIITNGETVETVTYFDTVTLEYSVGDTKHRRVDATKYSKILASTDKSLNLPLLPAVEDHTHQRLTHLAAFEQGFNFAHGVLSNEMYYRFNTWWKQNKIAASAKKWSDADMEAACAFGIVLERFKSNRNKFSQEEIDEEFKGFLSTLQPKLIAVELEIEQYESDELVSVPNDEVHPIYQTKWKPKVDENNFIKPVKWIYE